MTVGDDTFMNLFEVTGDRPDSINIEV